ncbi:MAG TPA: hypothetical protein VHG89_09895 [Verrucomicrobiae bacterium]|nr:hypothetical protein [Verrucomicrobiae bacterium]
MLKEVSDGKNHDGHAEIVAGINGAEIKIFAAHLHKVKSPPLKENFISFAELKFEFLSLTSPAIKSLLQRPLLPPPRGILA